MSLRALVDLTFRASNVRLLPSEVVSKTFKNRDVFARAYMDVLAAFLETTFVGAAIPDCTMNAQRPTHAEHRLKQL
jgi:hypothetical protein